MFTLTGIIDGKTYSLSYNKTGDGYTLSGDALAIEKLREQSKVDHGRLGVQGGVACNDIDGGYLSWDYSAIELAERYVFDKVLTETDDWEPILPDAIY